MSRLTCALLEAKGDVTTAIDAYYSEGAKPDTEHTQKEPEMIGGAAAGPWPGASGQSSAPQRKSAPRRGGIMSFADLRSSEDTGNDDPVNLYTGGERSGLNVENPENQGPNSLVNDILRQASQAQPREEQQEEAPRAFTGAGHSLAKQREPDSEQAAGTEPAASRSSILDQFASFLQGNAGPQQPLETVQRHLTFWQDGFSIGDGPLMHYDNPEHAEILRAIQSGRAPLDLLDVRQGQEVELVVAQRTGEKYQPPPPPPAKPFSGQGNRLGSAAPTAPAAPASTGTSAEEPAPPVDPSQPTTRVQVRLPDGGRVVIQLNQHNTVGTLRAHINHARPELAHGAYTLQGGFPLHPLADQTQTVADAGILNSVIVLQQI